VARAVKKVSWRNIALVAALGFAWTKLGLRTAVRDIDPGALVPSALRCKTGFTPKFVGGVWRCVPVEFG